MEGVIAVIVCIAIVAGLIGLACLYFHIRWRLKFPQRTPLPRLMKPFEKVAVEFATALVEERWDDARSILNPALRREFTAAQLKENLNAMFRGYADGPATQINFDPKFSMEDWPDKQEFDIGWVYVGIWGDDFVEAVTVIISKVDSTLGIREIEWGRP